MYTIYALVDPRTETPRYVGRTKHDPLLRLGVHWSSRHKHHCLKEWLLDLEACGLRPTVRVLETVENREGAEEKWIATLEASGCELFNKFQAPRHLPKSKFGYDGARKAKKKPKKLTREQNRLKQARWVARHREHRNEYQRQQYRLNLERSRAYSRKYQAKKKAAALMNDPAFS